MKHKLPPPQYEVSQQGVSHAPSFQSKCLFMNREVIGTIEPTKALASESAAVIFHNRYIAGGGGGASELENGEIPQAAAAPVPSADNSYKHSLKESVVELKPTGVLILIDLDNLPRAVRTLDDYMAENEDHPVCEVIAYASMGFNPGEELPEYVQLRRASSLDRDAADILMVFETAMKMNDLVMHHLYKGVLIVSKDHFATRLKEILISYKINAHHEAAYDSIVRALEDKFPQR
eukprot:CAMPEP_0197477838 /NCGR_PEP_ID=MMETSP1309-20131121/21112_1 /TAXON_ID=464262 /ORGANISM="Genus nov. species nov., Strain RCC998" /LENGTH=233 /DNA_ID=CAMNT_0043018981 /DNA_START=405 /DNA_END=1106 /DNA_ORIENTATION=+